MLRGQVYSDSIKRTGLLYNPLNIVLDVHALGAIIYNFIHTQVLQQHVILITATCIVIADVRLLKLRDLAERIYDDIHLPSLSLPFNLCARTAVLRRTAHIYCLHAVGGCCAKIIDVRRDHCTLLWGKLEVLNGTLVYLGVSGGEIRRLESDSQ